MSLCSVDFWGSYQSSKWLWYCADQTAMMATRKTLTPGHDNLELIELGSVPKPVNNGFYWPRKSANSFFLCTVEGQLCSFRFSRTEMRFSLFPLFTSMASSAQPITWWHTTPSVEIWIVFLCFLSTNLVLWYASLYNCTVWENFVVFDHIVGWNISETLKISSHYEGFLLHVVDNL